MSRFQIYCTLGFEHIADFAAYDHMLFLAVLCALFSLPDWRRVALLVTAFTIGHSLTLALVTLDVLAIPTAWVEAAIPMTILAAVFNNFRALRKWNEQNRHLTPPAVPLGPGYAVTVFFGLIHGMGFSNYLRALLGRESDVVLALLAFNVGLELGQLLIVSAFLILAGLVIHVLRLPRRGWILLVTSAGALFSFILLTRAISG